GEWDEGGRKGECQDVRGRGDESAGRGIEFHSGLLERRDLHPHLQESLLHQGIPSVKAVALLLPLSLAAWADLSSVARAEEDDWPQYRGPNRDDVSAEKGLLDQWPEGGPKLLWTFANAGVGYSGPAIVGGRLYTLGGRGDEEFLIALDLDKLKDGAPAEAWAVKVGPLFTWDGNRWSAG